MTFRGTPTEASRHTNVPRPTGWETLVYDNMLRDAEKMFCFYNHVYIQGDASPNPTVNSVSMREFGHS